jgi:hypothetical protein
MFAASSLRLRYPALVRLSTVSRWALLFAGLAHAGCEGEAFVRLSPPLVVVSADLVDFGEVPTGFRVARRVTVANAGQQELVVSGLSVAGEQAFGVVSEPLRVPPGQQAEVRLSFAPGAVRAYEGELVIASNASNAREARVQLRGVGVAVTSCGDCSAPPPPRCVGEDERVVYSETGTCVMDECEYTATMETCAGGCEAGRCRGAVPDAGVAEDASAPADSGTLEADASAPDAGFADAAPDASAPDASAPDASAPDASAPDASAPDAAPADPCGDASVTDSGLGAPNVVFDTPGEYVFSVPAGVTELSVRMWGAGGQGGNQLGASGGGGAFVEATLPVTPGAQLDIWVAAGGTGTPGQLGNGGGASFVRSGASELLVAAGGGGGGSDGNSGNSLAGGQGGAGGPMGENGGNIVGTIAPYCLSATGGAGATLVGGGAGGTVTGTGQFSCQGQPGGRAYGGRATGAFGTCESTPGAERWRGGGGQANGGGGGGGSGYFGGGGAGFIWTYCGGGGGGGASYVGPGLTGVRQEGGTGARQGRATESFGAGRGGDRCLGGFNPSPCTCNAGGNGRVELRF